MDSVPSFIHQALNSRVVFGKKCFEQKLAEEVKRFNAKQVYLVTGVSEISRQRAETAQNLLKSVTEVVVVDATARQHVPMKYLKESLEQFKKGTYDLILAIGGGSAVGVAKGIVYHLHQEGKPEGNLPPIVCVPTTFSGSEMTNIYGFSDEGVKKTGRLTAVKPATVLYDSEMLQGLSFEAVCLSIFNSLAHSVEALYAQDANPMTALFALEAIRKLVRPLAQYAQSKATSGSKDVSSLDLDSLLYGACLSALCLSQVGVSIEHKLAHTLGGRGLPHSAVHTVLVPHCLHFNSPAIPTVETQIAEAMDVPANTSPADFLFNLYRQLGCPTDLKSVGMKPDDIQPVIEQVLSANFYNPRPIDEQSLKGLLSNCFDGPK